MKIKKAKNGDIKYGAVDVLDDDVFDLKKATVLISIRVAGDVLEAYKARAAAQGKGYQTLMNEVLRREIETKDRARTFRLAEPNEMERGLDVAKLIRDSVREEMKKQRKLIKKKAASKRRA